MSVMNENERSKCVAACPSCGALGVGGLEGCHALFGTLGAREFADAGYFRMHRLTVDAYCLQHPERYMKSSKSAAAHLAAMCWSMEIGDSIHMPAPLKLWLDGSRKYVRVLPPPFRHRGRITIIDAIAAASLEDYETIARAWAKSAWIAWSAHWNQASAWVQEAKREYEIKTPSRPDRTG